ncbi:MAG: hypothetical protein KDL10_07530, partial [Kiritimatiellae bacterium]|nr:hypothetical protein [Kiritimatiellia bacterium]
DVMIVESWTTHAFLGGVLNLATSLVIFMLLAGQGDIPVSASWFFLKLAGSLILGLVVTPLVVAGMSAMEDTLGIHPHGETT